MHLKSIGMTHSRGAKVFEEFPVFACKNQAKKTKQNKKNPRLVAKFKVFVQACMSKPTKGFFRGGW